MSVTRAEVAARAHRRDLEALSTLLDAGGEKQAAARLGVGRAGISHRLCRLRERLGCDTTAQVIFVLADELHRYREGR